MTLTIAWLIVLTCANVGLLGLVVYAILKPAAVKREVQELFQGVQAMSSVVSRLDGQLDDVRRLMFGEVPTTPEAPPVAKRAPAKKTASKTPRKTAKKSAPGNGATTSK